MPTTDNTVQCAFCGMNLFSTNPVHYVSEGAICSMCMAKLKSGFEYYGYQESNKEVWWTSSPNG